MPSFDAYHGTTRTSAEAILKSREFKPGAPRDDHWLGKGAYFFRDDLESAKLWAISKIKETPGLTHETPYVLIAKIEVPDENFLDLDSREGLNKLNTLTRKYRGGFKLKGNTPREKTPAQIRHIVMTWLPESIWVIQRTFPVPSVYDKFLLFNAMGLGLNSRQVCVRNSKAIIRDTIDCVFSRNGEIVHRKRKQPRFLG
ncbi:hypothetical protein FOI68_17105 [Brevibacillus sp. LEMMJ03]|uniref:hypothetical protein n=1 Tax=Brevibacillus sp. LEMMJ03 TaxID=2595056 RepID=UPI0011808020|nr:hypothetical protein [Brevibacillus sp. LEMMJ03]TRY24370.1 hypothetical protein FOI68_17105 [Brevibacillus sp. LEMMJ03]